MDSRGRRTGYGYGSGYDSQATRVIPQMPPPRKASGGRSAAERPDAKRRKPSSGMQGRPSANRQSAPNRKTTRPAGSTVKKQTRVQKRQRTPEDIRREQVFKAEQLRRRKALRAKQAKRMKAAFRVFLRRLAVFGVMFTVLLILSAAIFFIRLHANTPEKPGTYQYIIGTEDDLYAKTAVSGSTLFRKGQLYLNMTQIAPYCDLTTAGDIHAIRFIAMDNDNNNVKFLLNTPIAYINGVRIRLSSVVVYEDGTIYVPAEFFEKYVTGLTISVDEKEQTVTVSRQINEEAEQPAVTVTSSETPGPVYVGIGFTLQPPEPTANIIEASLGMDLLEKTDPNRLPLVENTGGLSVTTGEDGVTLDNNGNQSN